MAKRKLQRFAEVETFGNVFHLGYEESLVGHPLKGKWKQDFFKKNHPLILELGCGKGEYTVGLGQKFPESNFLGIDIKGARLWKGAKFAWENKLSNIGFVRARIDFIEGLFGPKEVDEIWVTFPDPQPQESRENKRLTGPNFLLRYKHILKDDGIIHLKTDNHGLYEFTLALCQAVGHPIEYNTNDLYAQPDESNPTVKYAKSIQTYYEGKYLAKGITICYLKFRLA